MESFERDTQVCGVLNDGGWSYKVSSKVKTVCYTQVSVLSRFSQIFCQEEIFHSVRFMIKQQYKEDQAVFLMFYMIPCFITLG